MNLKNDERGIAPLALLLLVGAVLLSLLVASYLAQFFVPLFITIIGVLLVIVGILSLINLKGAFSVFTFGLELEQKTALVLVAIGGLLIVGTPFISSQIFSVTGGGQAFSVIGNQGDDILLTCWNQYSVDGSADFKPVPVKEQPLNQQIGTKAIVKTYTSNIQTDYVLNIDCPDASFASFNPTQEVRNTTTSIGGSQQTTREQPIFLRFNQEVAGNCEVTATYSGVQQSCDIPYEIGNAQLPPNEQPPSAYPNLVWVVVGVLAVFVFYLLYTNMGK